jgi:hypothetical protein
MAASQFVRTLSYPTAMSRRIECPKCGTMNRAGIVCECFGGSDQRLVLPVRLGEHPTRYHNWKSHFEGWTKREEEIAHAAYIAGWYHRCNQDPDAMGENHELADQRA